MCCSRAGMHAVRKSWKVMLQAETNHRDDFI
jgi:hypothetical protein